MTVTPTHTNTASATITPTETQTPTPTPTDTPTITASPTSIATPDFEDEVIDDGGIVDSQGVTVVDIDHDNDLDLVVAFGNEDDLTDGLNFSGTDSVYLYLNGGDSNGNGGGTNWLQLTIPFTGTSPIVAMQTTVADFDNDNDLDIAAVSLFDSDTCGNPISSCSPGQVIWFKNPGDMTENWETNVISDTVWGARYIDAADLTGDGLPDLVVSSIAMESALPNPREDGLYWFRNENNGSNWSRGIPIDMELDHVETVLAYDIDGDMITDTIAIGRDSNEIAWYENTRTTLDDNPTFTKHTIANDIRADHFALANMDDDSFIELIVTTNTTNTTGTGDTRWYDSPFTDTSSVAEGLWTAHPIADDIFHEKHKVVYGADFDMDDDIDVAIVTGTGGTFPFQWYRNDGNDNWSDPILIPNTKFVPYYYVTGGDIDGDQRPDIVTVVNDHIDSMTGQPGDNISWWKFGP
jgi:hypothetical protein